MLNQISGNKRDLEVSMEDHKHGDMNVDTHEKTFSGFIKFTMYSVYVILGILIFLALFAR